MQVPENEKKYLPIEKREIRGLTLENVVKYGALVLAVIVGYFMIQKKMDTSDANIIQLQEQVKLNRTDIQTLNIKVQTQETTIARNEERLNQKK